MNTSLHAFIGQFVGAVAAALIPVIVTAFLSIPYNLGGHPGEVRPVSTVARMHMS